MGGTSDRPTYLLVAEPDDALANLVQECLVARGEAVCRAGMLNLMEHMSIAVQSDGPAISGWLGLDSWNLSLESIKGVLLRPISHSRFAAGVNLADRHFLCHESLAAWTFLFERIRCPVINRLPVRWWLCDATLEAELILDCSQVLGVEPVYLPSPSPAQVQSIYLACGRTLKAEGVRANLLNLLGRRRVAMTAWQGRWGLTLVRLSFTRETPLALVGVDLLPHIEAKPLGLVKSLAAATCGALL